MSMCNGNSDAKKPLYHQANYIRCAYDRRHFVLEQKYELHLELCARNHPTVNLLFCPFNTNHKCRSMQALVNSLSLQYISKLKMCDWIKTFHFQEPTSRAMSKPGSVWAIQTKWHQRLIDMDDSTINEIQKFHFQSIFVQFAGISIVATLLWSYIHLIQAK